MKHDSSSRDRILQGAKRLIHTRSFADVGVAEICAETGVKKGSFYHYFASKQEMALAVLDAYAAERRSAVLALVQDTSLTALERLRRIPLLAADNQDAFHRSSGIVPGCPFGNMSAELSTQDEPIRARVTEIFSAFEAIIETLLREAVEKGELPALDTVRTAKAMFAYLEGVILAAKARNDPGIIRDLGPAMVTLRVP
jgi:TetR/AcrR family transcriptional repressor of nem operon